MAFFGPGGLSGATSTPGLDPELRKALLAQFPGLESLGQQQGQQPPRTLQGLGYQWPGVQLYQGQGTGSFQLSPFESAGGVSPESITGGLAQGTFGKSGSQSPLGTSQQQGSSLLSLPSLSLPMAQVAATQGGYGEGDMGGATAPAEGGGITISAGDVLGAADKIAGYFAPGTGTAFDPGQQTQTPAYQDYRAGERDLSTLGGSFLGQMLGPGQGAQIPNPFQYAQSFPGQGLSESTTFSAEMPAGWGVTNPNTLPAGTTFEMLAGGQSPTMSAPGGSAATALGPAAPQGDLFGGGLATLQGLYNLYGGTQSGDIGQLLGGASGTLGGLTQMAPETAQALSQYLGLGSQGLGLIGSGLGGLGGAYGLYQGVQQGDPLQALMGAGGLYAGAAPIINSLAGTSLPTLTGLGSQALGALGINLAG